MTVRNAIATSSAPAAIGPYSQAIRAGGLLFVSGQIGLDAASGKVVSGGISAETHQVLRNLAAILAAGGSSLTEVVKTTVFLADLTEFSAMNSVYETYFQPPFPARATVQAARLPRNVRVEIELVAAVSDTGTSSPA
jgi:2-iminobutanoate/2-iminopropanoate deaminase